MENDLACPVAASPDVWDAFCANVHAKRLAAAATKMKNVRIVGKKNGKAELGGETAFDDK